MKNDFLSDRSIVLFIAAGLISIVLAIVAGIFLTPHPVASWAETVLSGIAAAVVLSLKDCVSSLVNLAAGKQITALGTQLGNAAPPPAPIAPDGAPAPIPVVVKNPADEGVPVKPASDQPSGA